MPGNQATTNNSSASVINTLRETPAVFVRQNAHALSPLRPSSYQACFNSDENEDTEESEHCCEMKDFTPGNCVKLGAAVASLGCFIGCIVASPDACGKTLPFIASIASSHSNACINNISLQGMFFSIPGVAMSLGGVARMAVQKCKAPSLQNSSTPSPPLTPTMNRS